MNGKRHWLAKFHRNGRVDELGTLEARNSLEAKREAQRKWNLPAGSIVNGLVVERIRSADLPKEPLLVGELLTPAEKAAVFDRPKAAKLVPSTRRQFVGRIVLELELDAPSMAEASKRGHAIAQQLAQGRDELTLLAVALEAAQ